MREIIYGQRLRGRLTAVGPGLADVELACEGETPLGSEATFASQLEFADEMSFREVGTLTFANADALRLATIGTGALGPTPARGVRHGTAVLEAEGVGGLAGARGRITSNFVLSEGGDVMDEQVVILFVADEEEER